MGCPLEVSDEILNTMKKGSGSERGFERECSVRSCHAEGGNAGVFETARSLLKSSKSNHCGGRVRCHLIEEMLKSLWGGSAIG